MPVSDLRPATALSWRSDGMASPTPSRSIRSSTLLRVSLCFVTVRVGEEVAINGEGALTIEVRKTGKDTYLSQVIALVSEAQASRSRTQDLANRAALADLYRSEWPSIGWSGCSRAAESRSQSSERMVTVMVIACLHALGLTGRAGRRRAPRCSEKRIADKRSRRARARRSGAQPCSTRSGH